ncbi:MAG: RC-LH1 core complex protein PufX [Pseudomonadota bacterium]
MSDSKIPFDGDFSVANIQRNVLGQMVKGLAFVLGVTGFAIGFVLFFWYAGTFLPPDSKDAADPTPWEGSWWQREL